MQRFPAPRAPPGGPPGGPQPPAQGRFEPQQRGVKRPRQQRRRRKLPPREQNTLACLIKGLIGRRVVVELRNDVLLRGQLDDADDFLNLSLSSVVFETLQGRKREYDNLYVKGRNLRFVHLPRALDPATVIETHRQRVIQNKLQQAYARERQIGEVSKGREAKGVDAFAPGGGLEGGSGPGSGTEDYDEGEGEEYGDEEYEEGEEGAYREGSETAGGDGGGGREWEGGSGAARPPPLPGLQHLDPRAMAAAAEGGPELELGGLSELW